ncbi:golgin subfamily A member 2-like [Sapajus apella]|uniref:Golgin subfamily A member 2-like n=1 Tax=Sapajus apella TaxID=9515 RepID=A0A6J3HGS4_SAPAP|nr:golgin subfamily A member 2-like [Sapajus apella]
MAHWIFLGICKMRIVQPGVVTGLGFVELGAEREMVASPATSPSLQGPFPLCFGQIEIFKMEKRQDAIKIEELKGTLAHLQNHLAEPPIPKQPAGPSDLEKNLKTETKYLRDELREQERQQEAKMRLREQEVRLREQEQRLLEQEGLQEQEEELVCCPPGDAALLPSPPELCLDIIIPAPGMEPTSHRARDSGVRGSLCWVPFLNAAGAGAQEEQARLCEQLQKQQGCCQHQAVGSLREPEAAAAATGTGSQCGCGETQRALQGAINKLQNDFIAIMKENVDLKERVEKLELGFIQLSGERDMIRKSIKPNDHQTAVAKTQHQKKNDVSMLSEAEEGMKVRCTTSLRG